MLIRRARVLVDVFVHVNSSACVCACACVGPQRKWLYRLCEHHLDTVLVCFCVKRMDGGDSKHEHALNHSTNTLHTTPTLPPTAHYTHTSTGHYTNTPTVYDTQHAHWTCQGWNQIGNSPFHEFNCKTKKHCTKKKKKTRSTGTCYTTTLPSTNTRTNMRTNMRTHLP